jgi:DNA-binding transcriptional MerR regulator
MPMYTVKQLSELATVSVRTLHYYDEIGLLKPSRVGANGYRYYDDDALLRLQQILFYREIGLELMQIKDILDSPDFDLVTALRSHRASLLDKTRRIQSLIETIDNTIEHLTGAVEMSKKKLFQGFNPEKQKEYERQARLQYGSKIVNESVRLWNSYSEEKQAAILEESGQVYVDLAAAMEAGKAPDSDEVQNILERWQNHMRYFYEPTLDILRGLGMAYNTDPEFIAFFQQFHPDLPAYLQESITLYVDDLEYAEIARMLAEDEAGRLHE